MKRKINYLVVLIVMVSICLLPSSVKAVYSDSQIGTYETELAKFPADYKAKIEILHGIYPNAVFVAQDKFFEWTNYTEVEVKWADMLNAETVKSKSLISRTVGNTYPQFAKYVGANSTDTNWPNATTEGVEYFMNPLNFLDTEEITVNNKKETVAIRVFMFESQYYKDYQNLVGIEKILSGTFMSNKTCPGSNKNYADVILEAAIANEVSPYMLASRLKQENGTGSSPLISGNVSVTELVGGTELKTDGTYLSGIYPGMLASDLISKLKTISNVNSVVITNSSNENKTNELVTGDKVNIVSSNGTKTYTIVIYGDVNGDGKVLPNDYVFIKNHILKKIILTGASKKAANINKDITTDNLENILPNDYVLVKNHILKKSTISQNNQYKGYYNYFNVGAGGDNSQEVIINGIKKAQEQGWTSPYLSIKGGSKFIKKEYIGINDSYNVKGQMTNYLQKWDPYGPKLAGHQYMQNVSAPYSEARTTFGSYASQDNYKNYKYVFYIPLFK